MNIITSCTKQIPFSLELIQALGTAIKAPVPAAVLLCYIADLQEVDGHQVYVYKTLNQIVAETGLCRNAVKNAKTVLHAMTILVIREKDGGWRIDAEALMSVLNWYRANARKEG